MKKIVYTFLILLLTGCAEYKPIFSNKEIGFYIGHIKNIDDDNISKQIIRNLNPYTVENEKPEIRLEIKSNKKETIVSRDNKGDPQIHEIKIQTNVKIIKNTQIKELEFKEIFSFNNQNNKFEFSQYKKNIQKNLTNRIFEKLILELQSAK